MIYKIINILASLFMVLMTAVMVFGFRKPRRVTFFSSLFSVLMSIAIPVLYILITGLRPDLRLALPWFSFGMLLGFLRGQGLKLSFVGDQVVGRHSILFLLLWGLSLALNQALSTPNPSALMAVGLAALFLSSGTQVGFYGILAVRRLALIPPELDRGKLTNKNIQSMILFAFGGLAVLFWIETLLISIPALPFFAGTEASDLPSGDELVYPGTEVEQETTLEESQFTQEAYFKSDQILLWTRPLAAFGVECELVLYSFKIDGSGVEIVYDQPLSGTDIPESPYLLPDRNMWIAYSRRTGEAEQYLMTPDGSRTYQLRYQNAPVLIKDWSADLSQFLVQSQASGSWDVLITDREGLNWQVVANQNGDQIEPRWSGDGEYILYQSDQDGNQEIYRVGVNGGEPVNLTNHPAEDKRASWALNGTRILFTSDRNGYWGLYSMNSDGGDLRLISQDPNCGFKYQLSPDQDHFSYAIDAYYDGKMYYDEKEECYNTSHTISALTGGEDIILESSSGNNPLWSPDGKKVLYPGLYDQENNQQDLFVIHADGSGLANISPPSHSLYYSIWSPDSTRIAQIDQEVYQDGSFSRFIISITDIDGGNRQELAPLPWEREDGIAIAFDGFSWP